MTLLHTFPLSRENRLSTSDWCLLSLKLATTITGWKPKHVSFDPAVIVRSNSNPTASTNASGLRWSTGRSSLGNMLVRYKALCANIACSPKTLRFLLVMLVFDRFSQAISTITPTVYSRLPSLDNRVQHCYTVLLFTWSSRIHRASRYVALTCSERGHCADCARRPAKIRRLLLGGPATYRRISKPDV